MARYLSVAKEAYYPQLQRDGYEVTSDFDRSYNCIAHAAGRNDALWWPIVAEGVYWPPGVPLEETVDAFVAAYATMGYVRCRDGDRTVEPGVEKIALYVEADGTTPSHAALQLPNGSWSSKLGDWEDISHRTLEALEDDGQARGLGYGKVAAILKRLRPKA